MCTVRLKGITEHGTQHCHGHGSQPSMKSLYYYYNVINLMITRVLTTGKMKKKKNWTEQSTTTHFKLSIENKINAQCYRWWKLWDFHISFFISSYEYVCAAVCVWESIFFDLIWTVCTKANTKASTINHYSINMWVSSYGRA